MDNSLVGTARRVTGISTPVSQLSNKSKIALALTTMALARRGEWGTAELELAAERLSRENFDDVIDGIAKISDTSRREGEAAIPDTGSLLLVIRSINHPLRHLREIVTKLAKGFGRAVDEELLQVYQDVAGHRTDADLDQAYATILRDETIKRMPTPGQFLEACGILRVRRDGSRA